jgi:magnesium-transporting ATPase (P-type)
VICSDKTGTLTTNEMCAKKLLLPSAKGQDLSQHDVEGHNYKPVGKISGIKSVGTSDVLLQEFCRAGALCNDSRLESDGRGTFARVGEPTEAAVRVLVEKLGCPDQALNSKVLQKDVRTAKDAQAISQH